ncbi:MAG: hypothetical protein H0U54_18045 [Acidobacteria bacterium]|nr:hypothetical protein [Acidobacteriota bacterium]
MKQKMMLMMSLILGLTITIKAQRQDTTGQDDLVTSSSAVSTLPDVIVESVSAADLDGGPVTVIVKNQGPRKAQQFGVELKIIGSSSDKELFNQTGAAGPLLPGQWMKVIFQTKMGLSQLRYCATADTRNRVAESIETNNRQCGRFSGKP